MAEKRVAQLHELLAVEGSLFKTANAMLDDAKTTFTKKPDHFLGQTRTVTYFAEDRQKENTTETKVLVDTVGKRLDYAFDYVRKYWDAVLQKEATNQNAVADLYFRGAVIAQGLPGTFYLGMEERLKKLLDVVLTVPTHNPSFAWTDAPDKGDDVFEANSPVAMKTEKKLEYITVAPATDKHPAQVKDWSADVNVAKIEVHHTSGMWTPARKAQVLANIDELKGEVVKARQRANATEVVKIDIGKALIDAILSE